MPLNRSSISICLLLLLTGVSSYFVGTSSLYLYLSPNLPSVESLRDVKFQTPLRIYSADDKLIGEFGERRVPINLEDVSPLLIKAFIAAEDDSFYSHNGFSPKGFLRAASQYLIGKDGGGGSTLTMQVAKMCFMSTDEALRCGDTGKENNLLNYDQSLLYKAVQILLAKKIESELTKNEILETYLNQVYLGHHSYGVQASAQSYYGKDVAQLTLAQAAIFAGIQPGPSIYNPVSNPKGALDRRHYVLRRMLELDFIDQAQFEEADAQPITAKLRIADFDLDAPYIREMARSFMEDNYGKKESQTAGYRVYTTVDSKLQTAAQQAVVNGLIKYDDRHGYRPREAHFEPVYYRADSEANNFEESESGDEETKMPVLYPKVLIENPEFALVPSIAKADGEDLPASRQLLLDPWLEQLKPIPTYGGFRAAGVVKAESVLENTTDENGNLVEGMKHTIEVVLANGDIVSIPWENGPSSAKQFINVNGFRNPPSDTSFLKVGDVIRVQQRRDRSWHLVQVPEAQAALVALDPNTGAVKALAGGFDYYHSPYNRIMQAERQPGSNIKPFLYTYALENGYSPAKIVNDAPYSVDYDPLQEKAWRPSNSGNKYRGLIPLREALYRSINMVSIRMVNDLPRRGIINSLERFGFDKTKFLDDGLSVALGSQVLRPIDVATGYAAFANGGYKIDHYFIERIELEDNGVIYEADHPVVCRECELEEAHSAIAITADDEGDNTTLDDSPFDSFLDDVQDLETAEVGGFDVPKNIAPRIIEERIVFLMDNMLKDVIKKGTGVRARRALNQNNIAGKTGTTNENTDAWFSGYNHHLVASTWIGFDQNSSLGRGEEGSNAALPIWIEFMRTALRGIPDESKQEPLGISRVKINPKTGLRTHNPEGVFDYFLVENVPGYEDDIGTINPIFDNGDEDAPDELY